MRNVLLLFLCACLYAAEAPLYLFYPNAPSHKAVETVSIGTVNDAIATVAPADGAVVPLLSERHAHRKRRRTFLIMKSYCRCYGFLYEIVFRNSRFAQPWNQCPPAEMRSFGTPLLCNVKTLNNIVWWSKRIGSLFDFRNLPLISERQRSFGPISQARNAMVGKTAKTPFCKKGPKEAQIRAIFALRYIYPQKG